MPRNRTQDPGDTAVQTKQRCGRGVAGSAECAACGRQASELLSRNVNPDVGLLIDATSRFALLSPTCRD